jgi:hypothetical protein
MRLLKRTAMLPLLIALMAAPGTAQNRLTWSDFSARMTPRHTVRMVLPDGTTIEARPLAMKSDGAEMRITKTSNRLIHPKGPSTIPRAAFSVVQVRSPRWRGRMIGTLAPIGAGIVAMASAYGKGDAVYGYLVGGGLTAAGGGVGGYFIGRAVDRRFEQFAIDTAAAAGPGGF